MDRTHKRFPEGQTNSEKLFTAVQKVLRGECSVRIAAKNFSVSESSVLSLFEQSKANNWTNEELRSHIFQTKEKKERDFIEEMLVEVKMEPVEAFQCRGCRTEGAFERFFSIHEEGLKHLFSQLTGIEVAEEDLAPKYFCESCRRQLMNFSSFRATCIESNVYFNEKSNELEFDVDDAKSDVFAESIKSEPEEKPVKKSKKKKTGAKRGRPPKVANKNVEVNLDRLNCNECRKTIHRKRFLWHWRYEHQVDENPSTCTDCPKVLSSIFKLEDHQRKEHGILRCVMCSTRGTIYSRDPKEVQIFQKHLRQCNKDPKVDPFKCRTCKTRFSSYKQFTVHESKCSGLTILCHFCCKSVDRKSMKQHMEMHSPEEFPCRTCGKAFPSKVNRRVHERFTCEVEEVICDYCGRICRNKAKLLGHIKRTHFGQKKITKVQCTICGVIVRDLTPHMLIHTNERNYHCDYEGCGMSFKRPNALRKHKFSHSKTRPYNCTLCATGYYHTDYLRGHYQRTHGLVYEKGQSVPFLKPEGVGARPSENIFHPKPEGL